MKSLSRFLFVLIFPALMLAFSTEVSKAQTVSPTPDPYKRETETKALYYWFADGEAILDIKIHSYKTLCGVRVVPEQVEDASVTVVLTFVFEDATGNFGKLLIDGDRLRYKNLSYYRGDAMRRSFIKNGWPLSAYMTQRPDNEVGTIEYGEGRGPTKLVPAIGSEQDKIARYFEYGRLARIGKPVNERLSPELEKKLVVEFADLLGMK